MDSFSFKPIGVIHTSFKKPKGTPIQPGKSDGARGTVEVYPEYVRGLTDLDRFSHITLLYYFHLSKGFELMVTPYLDDKKRGLFATRAPRRPNPIGLSVVKLDKIEGNILHIINVDMIDGSPLLDIKPYVPQFDVRKADKIGWIQEKTSKLQEVVDDGRFGKP